MVPRRGGRRRCQRRRRPLLLIAAIVRLVRLVLPLFLLRRMRLHVLGLLAVPITMPAAMVQLIGGMAFAGAEGDNGQTSGGYSEFAEGVGAHGRDSSQLL